MIPWGLDQIFQDDQTFCMRDGDDVEDAGLLNWIVEGDQALSSQLRAQMQDLQRVVFSRASIEGELKVFIDLMASQLNVLTTMGLIPDPQGMASEIAEVRGQLVLARSAAYIYGGYTGAQGNPAGEPTGVYLVDNETGNALYADKTEIVDGEADAFQVFHQPRQNSVAQRWWLESRPLRQDGFAPFATEWSQTIVSEWTGDYLTSSNVQTLPGHYLNMTAPAPTFGSLQRYYLELEVGPSWDITGLFALRSQETGRFLRFANDDPSMSSGRQRVVQIDPPCPLMSCAAPPLATRVRMF